MPVSASQPFSYEKFIHLWPIPCQALHQMKGPSDYSFHLTRLREKMQSALLPGSCMCFILQKKRNDFPCPAFCFPLFSKSCEVAHDVAILGLWGHAGMGLSLSCQQAAVWNYTPHV